MFGLEQTLNKDTAVSSALPCQNLTMHMPRVDIIAPEMWLAKVLTLVYFSLR